jgi:hypothetical protein
MRTIKKKLSKEQIERGIIYTSTLSTEKNESLSDTIHEIYEGDNYKNEKMRRLEDTKFFKNSPFKYNIVRTK